MATSSPEAVQPAWTAHLALLLCLAGTGAAAAEAPGPDAPAGTGTAATDAGGGPKPPATGGAVTTTALCSPPQGTSVKGTIASPDPHKPPINWHADHMDLDYQSHHVVLHGNVAICQSDVMVVADKTEATGMDFKDAHWVLTGHVHVTAESEGQLHSDQATLDFSNNLLARAVVTGDPAEFEQTQSSSGVLAHGHAGTIDYEVPAGTVRLSDNAWLSNGPNNEMAAPELAYNVRTKQIEGTGSPTGGRVHATVQPRPGKSGSAAAGKSASPAPGSRTGNSAPAPGAAAPTGPRP